MERNTFYQYPKAFGSRYSPAQDKQGSNQFNPAYNNPQC